VTTRVPRFRSDYLAATVEGAGTFLLTETMPTVLNGALYELVCPLVDGHRSVTDIVDLLRSRASPAQVYYALDLLEQRGFVEEATDGVPPGEAAFWHACGVEPDTARRRLATGVVRVVALGGCTVAPIADALADALAGAGVVVTDATDAPFTLVATDDYRRPDIDAVDEEALALARSWALVKPVGVLPFVGPFFSPGTPGCWRCLVDRMRMNYATDTFVEEHTGSVPVTATAALDTGVRAVLDLAALELAKWIARDGDSNLVNTLVSLSLVTMGQERHALSGRPQCRRCGEPEYRTLRPSSRSPRAVPFQRRPRRDIADNGHRTATPDETLRRYAHLVSPITGVVSRLDRVSSPEHPVVHAYAAHHNWATHPDSLAFLKRTLRSQSGGKGVSDIQARVGAMAEAFERYSGVYRGDETLRRAHLADLGDDAVLPDDVLLFSKRQYDGRAAINAEGNSFQMVPEPFDVGAPADWSPMWAPTADAFRWLPTGLLYYGYSKSVPRETPNRLAAYADSNGCAAGTTLEDATLQALLELVERDAVATWWYSQVRRPAVDLDDLADRYLDELREWLAGQDRELWVLDITNDVGIPAFAAVSRRVRASDADGEAEQVVVGFGAHLDPRIGVMRAVTEVNQFFATLFSLGEADLYRAFDPGAVEWWTSASIANKPYLNPADGQAPRRLGDYAELISDDLLDEVHTTIGRIEARGPEVLLLDQTRPDVGFSVIKALAPGLRHFWARLAPGRLYDVPVELGWLPAPLAEQDLNPTPVFF
jgi:oxazoline/thiazoline synthase